MLFVVMLDGQGRDVPRPIHVSSKLRMEISVTNIALSTYCAKRKLRTCDNMTVVYVIVYHAAVREQSFARLIVTCLDTAALIYLKLATCVDKWAPRVCTHIHAIDT